MKVNDHKWTVSKILDVMKIFRRVHLSQNPTKLNIFSFSSQEKMVCDPEKLLNIKNNILVLIHAKCCPKHPSECTQLFLIMKNELNLSLKLPAAKKVVECLKLEIKHI